MTAQELIDIIKENDLQEQILDDGIWSNNCEELSKIIPEEHELLDAVCNSDEMYCVVWFKESNVFLKLTGEYDSYGDGNHDYDEEVTQVFPKEITKIIYE